jgi:S-adenosylmethionine-diacylgycerolhomoserine-N-methlytransferase
VSVPADGAAELMDRIYRRQRYFYDATRKYFLLGRDHLIRALNPPDGGSVLEIGCGTGRNLIAAARAYPTTRFFGLDISTAMLAAARANLRSAHLEERIALARGDAVHFDAAKLYRRTQFDVVFFSYSLSMIPEWRNALEHALGCIVPGGRLLIVDFGQQERLPAWCSKALFAWLARFHVTPRADLREAVTQCAEARGASLAFLPLYRGYAWHVAITR